MYIHAPPVTKSGLKEYLLELIIDADLVCQLIVLNLNHSNETFSLSNLSNNLPSTILCTIFALNSM